MEGWLEVDLAWAVPSLQPRGRWNQRPADEQERAWNGGAWPPLPRESREGCGARPQPAGSDTCGSVGCRFRSPANSRLEVLKENSRNNHTSFE